MATVGVEISRFAFMTVSFLLVVLLRDSIYDVASFEIHPLMRQPECKGMLSQWPQ